MEKPIGPWRKQTNKILNNWVLLIGCNDQWKESHYFNPSKKWTRFFEKSWRSHNNNDTHVCMYIFFYDNIKIQILKTPQYIDYFLFIFPSQQRIDECDSFAQHLSSIYLPIYLPEKFPSGFVNRLSRKNCAALQSVRGERTLTLRVQRNLVCFLNTPGLRGKNNSILIWNTNSYFGNRPFQQLQTQCKFRCNIKLSYKLLQDSFTAWRATSKTANNCLTSTQLLLLPRKYSENKDHLRGTTNRKKLGNHSTSRTPHFLTDCKVYSTLILSKDFPSRHFELLSKGKNESLDRGWNWNERSSIQ